MENKPYWEHGYRTHGYWLNSNKRLGYVSLTPKVCGMKPYYTATIDVNPDVTVRVDSLKMGKKYVEEKVKEIFE